MKDSTPEWAPMPAGFKMSEARKPKSELRTFSEWSEAGFQILKGSKHVGRNADGLPLFSSEQVVQTSVPYIGQGEEGDEQSEEDEQDLPGNPNDFGSD